ncbi:MAG TPA: hypothetical protein VMU16_06200 [Candidatus Binataceae bacterium]|nr:hypothetical protein [Candidatus Binataceae bacterium]
MRSFRILPVIAIGLAIGISGCSAIEAERQEHEQKQQEFAQHVDMAHIWVTTDTPPPGKPYTVLGELKYTEPFSPDAIEEDYIKDKLKKMALAKWPDTIDAIVKMNHDTSADGSQITVTAEAIQYESSVDRAALHGMNEGMVASPNDNQ